MLPLPRQLFLLCCLLCTWGSSDSLAQNANLVSQIAASAREGHPRALRDLASLLDDQRYGKQARAALSQLTLVDRHIDVTTATRTELLALFYAERTALRYSDLLDGFYIRPIESEDTPYELVPLDAYQQSDRSMHLRKYINYTEQAIEYESVEDLRDLVEKIADLRLGEGQDYLLGLLGGRAAELLATEPDAFAHYLDQLLLYPSSDVAELLFESESRAYIRQGTLATYLSRLCNVPFRSSWSTDRQQQRYTQLVDSLGSLGRIRNYGYDSTLPFKRSFFREDVDYFGRILAEDTASPYVQQNALLDLIGTHHPRALFYVSAQLLRARQHGNTAYPAVYYLYLLRKLTGLGVMVPDGRGELIYQLDVTGDRLAQVNFVRYWGAHYADYDYDEHRNAFVNRHDHSLKTENLERLFRLLNSENDEVALQAYERLARADPVEVEQLTNKYRDLLRSTNPRVPALKDGHLEQTAQLTAYCVRNGVSYEASGRLAGWLDSLTQALEPRRRVALENRMIARLTLEDVTALEHWGSIHQYNLAAEYSLGRVLDYTYSKNWTQLVSNDAALRLYLKKAILFNRMDAIGVSDSYLRKFDHIDEATRARMVNLLRSENDRHIARALRRLLYSDQRREASVSDLDDFLEAPEQFTRDELADLPPPAIEQLSELLWRIADDATPKARMLYRTYLDAHVSIELVPDLMSLIIREESPQEVTKLLDDIYHFKWSKANGDPAQQWLAYWRSNSTGYLDWGTSFHAMHLEALDGTTPVTGPQLNDVLRSPHFVPAERAEVLSALPRLVSNRHLFMLKFEPALAWSERSALDSLDLGYKDLQDLDKLFPTVSRANLVTYVLSRAKKLDGDERGKLVNGLMRKPWIDDVLDDPRFGGETVRFAEALERYLQESEILSEFEEQNTALNLARLQFGGLSAAERLSASAALDVDEAAKLRIQESILARISYAELPEVLARVPLLAEVNGKRPYNFFNQDFGLPIFDLHEHAVIDTFVARYERLSERELYALYLDEFGVPIFKNRGELDYQAVHRLLRYDIVSPFVGRGGNRRDLYTYGVIRLLELTEGTRLGFHEKLNENQLFYSFSASKRAEAWMAHLESRGLIRVETFDTRPSFNASHAP